MQVTKNIQKKEYLGFVVTEQVNRDAASLEPAHTKPLVWFHKTLHHDATARCGSCPGYPKPEGDLPPQT